MVRKRIVAAVVAVLVVSVGAVMATSAAAFPTKTSQCSGCHDVNAAVVVTATQTSNDGTTATYSVSVSNTFGDGVSGWAVFDGTSNIANAFGAGNFSVAVGKSYKVWGVAGAGGQGTNSITISPVAPPPPADTTPPAVSVTSPADGATVAGSVAITADASDASGIDRVEFSVDGALLVSDTSSPYSATWDASGAAPGSHTILATAFDTQGNSAFAGVQVTIEAPAPPPPPGEARMAVLTVSVHSDSGAAIEGAKVVLRDSLTGARYVLVTNADGQAVFSDVPYGSYSLLVSARGHTRAKSSLVVDAPESAQVVTLNARHGGKRVASSPAGDSRRLLDRDSEHTHHGSAHADD